MEYLYVRAPGPGAIIRLVERFGGAEAWNIAVTPADVHSGFRCVILSECDPRSFATFLASCLGDSIFLIEDSETRVRIDKVTVTSDAAEISSQSVIDIRLSPIRLFRSLGIRQALRRAGLPLWLLRIRRLRRVSYETVQVLDQRDLLVEAPDVIYTAKANIPD